MRKGNLREKNGFWKGGRSIASNGYVLIKVGFDHHLADVRGYAYEHRLKAEEKIGRSLIKGEQVHHIDKNKQNNSYDNLVVVSDMCEHFKVEGRLNPKYLSSNGDNYETSCKCGCGYLFMKYDTSGRPRSWISGHNPSDSPTRNFIINELKSGQKSLSELISRSTNTYHAIKVAVSKMKKLGIIKTISRGIYQLNG